MNEVTREVVLQAWHQIEHERDVLFPSLRLTGGGADAGLVALLARTMPSIHAHVVHIADTGLVAGPRLNFTCPALGHGPDALRPRDARAPFRSGGRRRTSARRRLVVDPHGSGCDGEAQLIVRI
jgi:hypothetical protein